MYEEALKNLDKALELPSKNAKAISIAYSNKAYALIGLENLKTLWNAQTRLLKLTPAMSWDIPTKAPFDETFQIQGSS